MENEERELNIQVELWEPDPATLNSVACTLLEYPSVQEYLMGTQHRLLGAVA